MFTPLLNKRKDDRRVVIPRSAWAGVSERSPRTTDATLLMVRPIPAGGGWHVKSVKPGYKFCAGVIGTSIKRHRGRGAHVSAEVDRMVEIGLDSLNFNFGQIFRGQIFFKHLN